MMTRATMLFLLLVTGVADVVLLGLSIADERHERPVPHKPARRPLRFDSVAQVRT